MYILRCYLHKILCNIVLQVLSNGFAIFAIGQIHTDMRSLSHIRFRLGVAALLCLCTVSAAEAKVKLPALISDGMVLQREQPVKIWGTADAGESVQVTFEKKNAPAVAVKGGKLKSPFTATTDTNGKWSITLPSLKAGGPYTLQINDIELKNILIGDVWLCSGQSNMELPVGRVTDMFRDEIAAYSNEKIRHLIVPKVYNFRAPQEDTPPAVWKALTQENVMSFSALAYFFAKAYYEKTGVPVGLINASWGGTPVEAWISEEGLKEFPKYLNDKRRYEDDAYRENVKKVDGENFYHWNTTLYGADAGLHEATPWYAADYDDSHWKSVDMFSSEWNNNGLNPINGSHWFRREVEVPQSWNAQRATLRLGCMVDADSVYVNGTFVGTTAYQYPPRIYTIPQGVLKPGKNNITIRLISNGGRAHFVKEKPYKIICNNEEVSLEGEWKHRLGAIMPNAPGSTSFFYKPVCLYNAMIAPLENCTFKGVIWYQGESNVSQRNEYAALLTAMIADWRTTFSGPELPFYIVELADFLSKDNVYGRKTWAEMRQEQAKAAQTNKHATLIKNSDLGEWNDIHPLDKKTLGQRIAQSALQNTAINNK